MAEIIDCPRIIMTLTSYGTLIVTPVTYSSSSHIGWMCKMHIVEQEQDRVQSIILFGLALFTSPEGRNTSKNINNKTSTSFHRK